MLCWSYVLVPAQSCILPELWYATVSKPNICRSGITFHIVTHLLPFPHYYNVKQRVYSTYIHLRQIASPTRVTCCLHSYCWLHYVNYYNYQLPVMELLVDQTHQWYCGIQLFTFSQALGALSTAEDAQVVERLRLKVLLYFALYHTHDTYICIIHCNNVQIMYKS